MATYNHPGVYVEETLTALSNVNTDPGDFGAAFVGVSPGGGPVGPTLVSNWTQFQQLFGGFGSGVSNDLPYAVYAFFANSGGSAYIVRALNDDAISASLTINGTQTTPAPVLEVTASAPGTWASDSSSVSRVYVTVTPSAVSGVDKFDLTIEVGSGNYLAYRESFVDLSLDRSDLRYAPDIVNSPTIGSKYVTISNEIAEGTPFDGTLNPASTTKAPLTGGSEGTGTPDLVEATARLDVIERNLVVNVPGAAAADVSDVVTWAVASGRHFVVADVPRPASGETAAASVTAQVAFADALPNSSHVAVYGPWQYSVDPAARAGASRLTAPGGAVVGQFLRTDSYRGVHKAPAGVQTVLSGVVSPYANYSNTQQDTLTAAGVNLVKVLPGAGVCIWGSRTQGTGYPDRYVPVRRLLISIRSTLESITRFAAFEPNNEDLWSTLENTVGNYLQTLFDVGAFKGDSPDAAFYVRCDDTNNNAASADAGVVNIEVGVALKSPAEFIIIRLGQTQAGATVTDSLEDE